MSDTEVDERSGIATANKKTDITVTAIPGAAPSGVTFAMIASFPDGGGKQGKGAEKNDLQFDKAAGAFDLVFTLDDTSGKHLAFYPTFNESFWGHVAPTCPPPGPMPANGSICDGKVIANNQKLTLSNMNRSIETITFMLRFTGDPNGSGCPPYEYDPKIINGGDGPVPDNGTSCD